MILKQVHIINFNVKNNKNPKFKFGDHVRIQNIKIFLLKVVFQIGQKFVC